MSDDAQISDEHDVTIIQFSRTRVYRELSLKASELSDRIAACAAAARRVLGTGWPKNIYEEALGINLARDGIKFERNKSIDVVFRGTRIGSHCFAFIVDEEIAVELATSGDDRDFHPADFRSYLRVCDVQSGLLIDLRAEEIRVRHIGAEAVARGPEFPEQGFRRQNCGRPANRWSSLSKARSETMRNLFRLAETSGTTRFRAHWRIGKRVVFRRRPDESWLHCWQSWVWR